MARYRDDTASLDLRAFEAPQRSEIWRLAVARLFPGLKVSSQVSTPPAGRLAGAPMDCGQLWTVLSPALRVRHVPPPAAGRDGAFVSLMLQKTGTTVARQAGRECRLHARDLTLIDDAWPFELDIPEGLSEFVFLRMPRERVLARLPENSLRTAERLDARIPVVSMLEALLQRLPGAIAHMDAMQQQQALEAILQLLPAPEAGTVPAAGNGWRTQAAITFIDEQLGDRRLCAERVAAAQGIGRRRLDEVLTRELGTSATALIWQRRLLRAADDLRNPRLQECSVTQIALQCGFEHAAHFTRAFRRQFQCTPSQWRARAVDAAHSGNG